MANRINELLLKEYTERFQDADTLIAIGYEGLDANATNDFRAQLEERGGTMFFVKNRILRRAFNQMEKPDAAPLLDGQTALAAAEDPVSLARFFVDYRKEHKELRIHGALVESKVLNEPDVVALSKSPTKEELKGIISGQALSPGGKLSSQLLGPAGLVASQIKKHAETLENGEEAA